MSHNLVADRQAADAVLAHHAQLFDTLTAQVERLVIAAESANGFAAGLALAELRAWLRDDLLPHAAAEEDALYPAAAARTPGRLLVDGMIDEHHTIGALVAELDAVADSPVRAAAIARALLAVFTTHLAKENNLILPLLLEADDVALAELLEGMHAILGGHDHGDHDHDHGDHDHGDHDYGDHDYGDHDHGDHDHGGLDHVQAETSGGCGCGGGGCGSDGRAPAASAEPEVLSIDPRIDVREVPHAQRHAQVLAALDAIPAGGALVLVAGHAPRPLLAEVEVRYGGQFETQWLQAGPSVWQIRLHRTPVHA